MSSGGFIVAPDKHPCRALAPSRVMIIGVSSYDCRNSVGPSSRGNVRTRTCHLHPRIGFMVRARRVRTSIVDTLNVSVGRIRPTSTRVINSGIPVTTCKLPKANGLHGNIIRTVGHSSSGTMVVTRRNTLYVNGSCSRTFGITTRLRGVYRAAIGGECHLVANGMTRALNSMTRCVNALFSSDTGRTPMFRPYGDRHSNDMFGVDTMSNSNSVIEVSVGANRLMTNGSCPTSTRVRETVCGGHGSMGFVVRAGAPTRITVSGSNGAVGPLLSSFTRLINTAIHSMAFGPGDAGGATGGIMGTLGKEGNILLGGGNTLYMSNDRCSTATIRVMVSGNYGATINTELFRTNGPVGPVRAELVEFVCLGGCSGRTGG